MGESEVELDEDGNWPEGCGYQGYEFGASYPDSICSGGYLLDADNCDGNGNIFEPIDSIPCPMCHPNLAIQYHANQFHNPGEVSKRKALESAKKLVADIRNNRKNGTEPWKTK